ncbi:hypothetical protein UPYG_G00263890 [Umbra pygmaea]|uniref:Cilia- and flagella-associated protein 263 n=1 Tax=Umbra pygmaea TaxID=75934 RepID=A0ABD0WX04_UMBPY
MEEAILKEVQVVSDADRRDIVEHIEELRRSNAILRAENETFERFISRLEPRDLVSQPERDSLGPELALERQCLTLEQKCEIAKSEIGEMRNDMENLKKSSEREIDHYKASLKEAGIQLAEVRTERRKFEQLVKVVREKRGVMMGPEKVIHFIEDGIRSKDTLIEKLRLKNKLHLRQHAEFQELKIKNKFYVKCINEVNQQYLQLNLQAGDNQQVINSYKKKLHSATCVSKGLSSDIASRKKMLLKIEEETVQAEKELAKEETLNKNLRGQLADAHAPDVMQYISAKESHDKLKKSVRAWDRKVNIAEMDLKTKTEAWKTLKRAARKGQVAPN